MERGAEYLTQIVDGISNINCCWGGLGAEGRRGEQKEHDQNTVMFRNLKLTTPIHRNKSTGFQLFNL